MRTRWGVLAGVVAAVAVIATVLSVRAWATNGEGLPPGAAAGLVLSAATAMLLVLSARQRQVAVYEAMAGASRFVAFAHQWRARKFGPLDEPNFDAIRSATFDAIRRDAFDLIARLAALGLNQRADEVARSLGEIEAFVMRTTRGGVE